MYYNPEPFAYGRASPTLKKLSKTPVLQLLLKVLKHTCFSSIEFFYGFYLQRSNQGHFPCLAAELRNCLLICPTELALNRVRRVRVFSSRPHCTFPRMKPISAPMGCIFRVSSRLA